VGNDIQAAVSSSRANYASPKAIVLKSKLYAPSPRPEYLPRPRLLKLLRAGLKDCRITLIDAPPGYGKTTLLAQWGQTEGDNLPIAWVSLDEQDNDPVRLWAHLSEALRQFAPEEAFETEVLRGLGSDWNGDWKNVVETKLPILINGLTELPQRVTIVLDDYHYIQENECHKMVAYFVERLPETAHVVFSTRHDLPLPLGRWRARGEVNEIRAEQLAFSEEEVASLFKDNLHLDIDPGDLHTLLDRTEGWPAALYLATLSLQDKKDAHAFIESFRGSNRFVVEILAEEVLATLSEEEREFLLLSSILDKLSASLCEAVTRMENAGKLLRELEHSNLFVVPLDDHGEWYRYHHLFADFLRYELRSTQPHLVPVLHKRASGWFEQAGLVETAINHALTAGEFAWAGQLVARYWFRYAMSGQRITLERWLAALPEDLVSGNAALALVKAWVFALEGRREECEGFLTLAEGSSYEGKLPDGSASVEAGVALVRGLFGYGGIRNMVEAARRAQELEPPEQTSPRKPLVCLAVGMSMYYSGESSAAKQPLEEALRLAGVNQPVLQITVLCTLSFVAADRGQLEKAESYAREARAVVNRFGLEWIPQSSAVPIALGLALAGREKVTEAGNELERGLSLRRRFTYLSPWPTLVGLLALAPVRAARGDRDGARALLVEARAIMETYPDAGMFPGLLERRERELHRRKQREGVLTRELTERELAVLLLLTHEHSNREIGRTLYISPNTVKAHVKSIYRKLGVSSREDAAKQGRARGLT
jgi:LuxR family transcriptional regulator, maltose regulon positive regulatory protein